MHNNVNRSPSVECLGVFLTFLNQVFMLQLAKPRDCTCGVFFNVSKDIMTIFETFLQSMLTLVLWGAWVFRFLTPTKFSALPSFRGEVLIA